MSDRKPKVGEVWTNKSGDPWECLKVLPDDLRMAGRSLMASDACYARYLHPRGFRSGQWARTGAVVHRMVGRQLRTLLQVTFIDGVEDTWPVFDEPPGTFQFSNVVTA